MFSQAEENYLKSIYGLEKEMQLGVSTNLIAKKMQTKASSVTDMLKKLALKELVVYKKYQGVYLTEGGRKIALRVVRKHRLWECFLVEKLHFKWEEVHQIAEQLEHVQSDSLVDKLDDFLGNPKWDPHGDPIPDRFGNIIKSDTVNILGMHIGGRGVLESVKDSTDAFLKYLNNKSLALGDHITILDIEPFDSSIQIKTKTGAFTISKHVAENLYLKTHNNDL